MIRETVGSQDQALAAYGGFNHLTFQQNGEISVRPVVLSRERIAELNDCLMLFYTGIKRTASNVADSYVNNMEASRRQLRIMKDLVEEAISILNGERTSASSGNSCTRRGSRRRASARPSRTRRSTASTIARSPRGRRGKADRAGGGGFLLLFVPPPAQVAVRGALSGLIHVPFHFEYSGSQIIFFEPRRIFRRWSWTGSRIPSADSSSSIMSSRSEA